MAGASDASGWSGAPGGVESRYIHAFGTIGRGLGLVPFHQHWLRHRAHGGGRGLWDFSASALAAQQLVDLVDEDERFEQARARAEAILAKAVPRGGRSWTTEAYLQSEHVAPMAFHAAAPGVIDEHLAAQGLQRNVVVRSAHFSLIPLMVARSWLVLTTGRLFCSRYIDALEPAEAALVKAGVPYTAHAEVGHLGETIAQRADDLACDLIVMGAHGRGALADLLLGSIATRVVHLARMPVLLVK